MTPKEKKLAKEEAITFLRERLKPDCVIYTIVTHAAASGMSRSIVCCIIKDGDLWDVSGWVARVCGYRFSHKRGGVTVGGCGMDMGFHLVDTLSHAMGGKAGGWSLAHRWI